MRSLSNIIHIIIASSFMIVQPLFGQDNYQLDNNSTVKINGTSTLHDWESVVENKEITFSASVKDGVVTIEKLSLSVEVASIKSGKEVMDNKTYEALKESDYPNITFLLNEPLTVNSNGKAIAKGTLSLAGVKKEVEVEGNAKANNNAQIAIEGSYTLNMKDYNITPPTAMFGTIKTGEEITVIFDLSLTKAPNN